MSRNDSKTDGPRSVGHTLRGFQKKIDYLATESVPSVLSNLERMIRKQVRENPYQTLATAVSIGYGLRALNSSHLRRAAFRIGKLVALRAFANLEPASPKQTTHPGGNHAELNSTRHESEVR